VTVVRPGGPREHGRDARGADAQRVGVACAHCGLEVPAGLVRPGDPRQFCCSGCRQVYTLVQEWGFDQYYRLVDQQRGRLEPARVTGRTFTDFDDERAAGEATEEIGAGRRRTRLYLEGVHCAACVWLVEKLPAVLSGVDEVRLNIGSGVADVSWRPSQTRLSAVALALDRLGYTPHIHGASRTQEARRAEDRASLARLGVAAACSMNLMFLHGAIYAGDYSGMAANFQQFFRWFSLVVAIPVIGYSARPFFQTAAAGVRARVVHIDLPIAIALAAAFSASAWNTVRGSGPLWFDSLAMLVAALLGARQLQRGAQRAALERADGLRGAAFLEFARRLEGDGPDAPVVEVPLAALAPGDRVEIRSGDTVPVDGRIIAGRSSIDNAVLTGESVPQPVQEGDAVNAGATNLGARLVVRVDAAGAATRVGALLAIAQEALARKPELLRTTDRLARRFVQLILGLAVVTGLAWMPWGFDVAFGRVVALLVVACPCAIGLSIPLALSVALMRAARRGMFVKEPDALDRLRTVGTVLLDKTGTLTEGRVTVARWHGDPAALDLAQALESGSAHAVARAFQRSSGRAIHLVRTVDGVVETAGRGMAGRLDGHDVRVGNRAHVRGGGATVSAEIDAAAGAMIADGLSPVYVAVDGHVRGVAGIGDQLRADARRTVEILRGRGIRVRILSGDHPDVVRHVARDVGVPDDDATGGLTPEQKRDIVAELTEVGVGRASGPSRRSVVMVGDGVNDAAALALADVGIAVHGGTGPTIAAAAIVLTRDGVGPVVELIDGARRLRGVIRRNLAFSLIYNAAAAACAIAGLVGPLAGALLMPASSLTVVLSSTFTRTFSGARRGSPGRRDTTNGAGARDAAGSRT
jgi:P-type Cu2+ transporter